MEVLVVCGMIAALAGIAVPQYQAMAMHMRTGAAATRVLNDLAYTRAMAMRTGVVHFMEVTGGDGEIRYEVRRRDAPGVFATLRAIDLSEDMPGVSFSASGAATDPYGNPVTAPAPAGPIGFNSRGLPDSGATFFVSSDDGGVAYAVTINGSGRVRMWRRTGGVWQ